jgi:predicted  nucleic acid-binding Zn-ribbon protein
MSSGGITVTAGYRFNEQAGEVLDLSKMNRLGMPTCRVEAGSITRRELQQTIREQIDNASASITQLDEIVVTGTLSLASRVLTLESSLTDPATGNTGLATAIDTIKTRVTNAEGTIDVLSTRSTELESSLTNAAGAIVANATATSTLTTRVTATEGTITSLSTNVTNLSSRLTTAEGGISGNATATSALTTRVTTAEGTITSLSTNATNLNARLTTAEGNISGNATATSGLTTRVTATENAITSLSEDVTDLAASITSLDVTALSTAVSSLTTRVSAVEGTVTSLSTSVTNLGSRLTTAEGGVAANSTAMTALTTRVSNAEGTISSQATSITTISSTVGTLNSTVTSWASTLATMEGALEARAGFNLTAGNVVTSMELIAMGGSTPRSEIRFRADLMSEDFVTGLSGWLHKGNGDVEFNNGIFRGRVQASKMSTDNERFNPTYPSITLPDTSSASGSVGGGSFAPCVILYGVGLRAGDAATAYANYTYWEGVYNDRLSTYNSMYDNYSSDEYIDSTEQALLDAQLNLVNAAYGSFAFWHRVYQGATAALNQVFGRSHITFVITFEDGFGGTSGDLQGRYRVNGGAWINCGGYQLGAGVNPGITATFPLTIDLALTDTIEFSVGHAYSGHAGSTVTVYWSN